MPIGSDTQLHNLIALIKSGDQRAKSLLLDHASDRLFRLTRTMFRNYPSLRRWEHTDDVFQNSLIRLHRAMADVELESVRHFFNLASLQIRRELLDLKKHYFGPEGVGANHHTDHLPPDESGGRIYSAVDEPEDLAMWERFHTRVDSLPTHLRQVVDLLYYQGLTQEQASEELGLGLRTIKRYWQEAKLLLHEDSSGEYG